ncbi:MAG TPA: hypothetical protein VGB63_04470 [Pedobacter sp.]|jgi:hypothetical protein
MSKCNFSINFHGSADDLVSKAQTAITNSRGKFNGDSSSGAFIISTPVGEVSGSYAVEGQNFLIDIEDKPFLVSCSKIESTLTEYLRGS